MNSCRLLAGQILAGQQDARRLRNQADRLEIGHRIVERPLVERLAVGVGAGIADQHRVAVGRGLGDALAADGAGRGADIVDHDRLAEDLAHMLRLDARAHVDAATGGERNHERDRPGRPILRAGCGGKGDQCRPGGNHRSEHGGLLVARKQSRSSRAGSSPTLPRRRRAHEAMLRHPAPEPEPPDLRPCWRAAADQWGMSDLASALVLQKMRHSEGDRLITRLARRYGMVIAASNQPFAVTGAR